MVNSSFIRRVPVTIVKSTGTILSLRTETSTVVNVITVTNPNTTPVGGSSGSGSPLPTSPTQTAPGSDIVETVTCLVTTVRTFTLHPVFTVTLHSGSAPARTPGFATSLPSSIKTPPHFSTSSAPSSPTLSFETGSPPLETSTSFEAGSQFITSNPASVPQPSSGFSESPAKQPLLPTKTGSDAGEPAGLDVGGSNKVLARVIPSVFLPLFVVIVLAFFFFRKCRNRRHSATVPTLVPFTNPGVISRPIYLAKSAFNVMTKRRENETAIDRHPPNISGRVDGSPLGDSGVVALRYTQVEANPLPVVIEEAELPAASSDNLVVPASRSEIIELQTRLANIEARRISLPPPEYSSERG